MIGEPVLREIISAYFFFAAASPDLAAALRAVFLLFFALFSFEQTRAQDRHRFLFVLQLAPSVLTANDGAGRNVQYLHRRVGRVHALSARPAGARNFDPQILRLYFKI